MKAITTKWLGQTATEPTRIKAYDSDNNSVTLSVHSLKASVDYEAHKEVAEALVKKMNWDFDGVNAKRYYLIGGGIKNGYAFIFIPK